VVAIVPRLFSHAALTFCLLIWTQVAYQNQAAIEGGPVWDGGRYKSEQRGLLEGNLTDDGIIFEM